LPLASFYSSDKIIYMKGKSHHLAQAILVSCMDFRLQDYLWQWAKSRIKKGFDYLSLAGGVKNSLFVLEQIKLSYQLHQISEVYLINHEDCGAYGKMGSFTRHKKDLLSFKKLLKEKFPQLQVGCWYLKLNGEFLEIDKMS